MLDIVIPVHGRLDLLSECLDSIPEACSTFDYTITVVDDNSPEGIGEVKKFLSSYPKVKGLF